MSYYNWRYKNYFARTGCAPQRKRQHNKLLFSNLNIHLRNNEKQVANIYYIAPICPSLLSITSMKVAKTRYSINSPCIENTQKKGNIFMMNNNTGIYGLSPNYT